MGHDCSCDGKGWYIISFECDGVKEWGSLRLGGDTKNPVHRVLAVNQKHTSFATRTSNIYGYILPAGKGHTKIEKPETTRFVCFSSVSSIYTKRIELDADKQKRTQPRPPRG